MPRLLRAFSILFIGFPGALIWFYGAMLSAGLVPSVSYGGAPSQPWNLLLMAAIGATAVSLGYLMVIGNRILCDDPRERFAGNRFTERVLWNLTVQFSGILTAGAALTTFTCLFTADWRRLPLPLVLTVLLATLAVRLGRHWTRLRRAWHQEIVDTETRRALLDFHPSRHRNPGESDAGAATLPPASREEAD